MARKRFVILQQRDANCYVPASATVRLLLCEDAWGRLAAGERLLSKGDSATTMFVVRTGALQVHDGNVVYETVGPGGILGEMAIVDGAPRSAGVRAEHESEVIAVDRARFLRMVERTPFFSIRIMQVLTRRLRNNNERMKLT